MALVFNLPTADQFKLIVKNPFPVFAIVLTAAVIYLFYDNKDLHAKMDQYHQNDQMTMVKVIEQNTEALKANTEFFKKLSQ